MVAGVIFALLAIATEESLVNSLAFGVLTAICAAIVFFPLYYPCLALKPDKTHTAILLPSLVALAGLFGSIWATAIFFALDLVQRIRNESDQLPSFLNLILMGFIVSVITEAIYYIYISRVRSAESEKLEQKLRVMARDAELRALRAQLNPHFLFNSLNSISALTTANPSQAREMCILLSDFLRKSLRLGEQLTVTLSEELDLMKNYFAIEQIRFSPRLSVEWEIDLETSCAEIPTLLLQPLGENAVKHGISQLIEGGVVRVRVETLGENVLVQIDNPIDPETEAPKGLGLGIRQVNQRLATFFGADGRMEINSSSGIYRVKLFFPMMKKEVNDE
ncbi:MAG: histidine kinase [Holophagaceae bacterium]|nr:histidine kinase [Holophagaceae bacterium]